MLIAYCYRVYPTNVQQQTLRQQPAVWVSAVCVQLFLSTPTTTV
ncbi:MAG: helix-turn-helix domain-containing protein [Gammaproteobacteria bacterium]|nr:helix-turn-helix domain-containing protein [Gammaproteobacteria bacterium]